jgi:PAS domain S-box-containing protein
MVCAALRILVWLLSQGGERMQYLESNKPRSISRTLSVGLIITLVLVAGLSLGVNFILSSRKAKAELEARAEEYVSALADALKVPLWNYSEETIETICTSYAQNEFIAKLLVEDQKGAEIFKKEKVDQRLVVSRSKDIFYEGNLIGRVHIGLASGYHTAVNRQLFQSFSLTIIIMIGALLVMTGVLLRQFLKKPMSRFIKMVDAYAAGESDAFKQGISYSEFRPLIDVLDDMGEKVASQMRSIRKLNEDLEKRVAERTVELRKLSRATENSPDSVVVTDKNGTIEYVNPTFSDVTGYSAKEAIGQNPRILKSGNLPDSFYKDLWDTILSGKTWRGELLNRKKNAEEFWESTSISAIKNEEGEITHFVAVKQDITDRKKAEEIVKNSEQRLAQIINFLPDPTWVIDSEGKVVTWNQAMENLTGIAAEKMVGKGNYEYALPFYGERRPVLIDLVREWNSEYEKKYLSIKKEGNNLVSESHHPNLGDGGIYLSGIASLIYDADGQVAGAIESLRDTTERKHLEEEMRRNLEELERFNKLAIGREIKMIRLKQEVNELMIQLGEVERYKIVS